LISDDHGQRDPGPCARPCRQSCQRRCSCRRAVAGGAGLAPLGTKESKVVAKTLLGVDAQGLERPAPKVVNDDTQANRQLEPPRAGAATEIVVLEEAFAKTLVQDADLLQHLPTDEQTEPRQALDRQRLARELLPAPRRELEQAVQARAVIADRNLL